MQPCPHCGQLLLESATLCKYCETRLPPQRQANHPLSPTQSFQCPSCGSPLDYDGTGKTIRCPACGNSVLVPQELWQSAEPPPATTLTEPPKLSDEVKVLVLNGEPDRAIQFLRDQLFLRREDAAEVVARIESGQYGNLSELIHQAQRGFDAAGKE
jgi:DNA-directed RNA polymerase subunit RPC12/RpoP